MERKQLSQGHSLAVDHRGMHKSGHGTKATELVALTF